MHNSRVNACSTKDAYIFPRPYRMGLCASSAKDTVGRESIQYASGWVDDEALHEALSLLQGYTHTTFDSEEDLQERFDLDKCETNLWRELEIWKKKKSQRKNLSQNQ